MNKTFGAFNSELCMVWYQEHASWGEFEMVLDLGRIRITVSVARVTRVSRRFSKGIFLYVALLTRAAWAGWATHLFLPARQCPTCPGCPGCPDFGARAPRLPMSHDQEKNAAVY